MATPYDVIVIGGGPGGYVAAIRAAQLGGRVAVVESDRLGGTCLNRGCIPTKTMIYDAELYRQAASGQFAIGGDVRLDFARLMARKREVVEAVVGGVERLMALHHIDVYAGRARVPRPGQVQVRPSGAAGKETLDGRAIIVATGSVPARVSLPGADLPGVMTSDGLMELDHLPRSVVVVGASAIGLEFACMFEALGSQVTVLGRNTFLKDAEEQLTKRFRTQLSRRGVAVQIGLEFREIVAEGGELQVRYERRGGAEAASGEMVLLSTGRRPYAGDLGLEDLGVAMKGRAIAVNEYLETSVPGIYAIGDCIGGYMFAHVASHEGEVAAENILGPERRPMDYTVVPYCFFTNPEIASVGLTEAQAKAAGLAFQVSRFPYRASGRALSLGEEEGQVRLICATEAGGRGGRVLGVHIMGAQAGTLIAEAALAMRVGATAEQISTTIHTHPTLPEMVMEAAKGQLDGAIHYDQR